KWSSYRTGILRFLASLEFYPKDYVFYFLGRDGEPLYDMARVFHRNDRGMLSRLRMINVSRPSKMDTHLWDYLAQEGISAAEAAKGRRFLLVDTGMRGTVSDRILETAPSELKDKILSH